MGVSWFESTRDNIHARSRETMRLVDAIKRLFSQVFAVVLHRLSSSFFFVLTANTSLFKTSTLRRAVFSKPCYYHLRHDGPDQVTSIIIVMRLHFGSR